MSKINFPFKKPEKGFDAVPSFLMKRLILACAGIGAFVVVCIMVAIFTKDASYLFGILFAAFCIGYGFFEKVYPFMTDTAYVITGTVVQREANILQKVARPVVYIALEGDVLVKVPLNRRNNDYVEGTTLRVYYKGDVMETSQNSYTLLDVIAVETTKVGIKKK